MIPYKKNTYDQEMIDAVVNYMKEGSKLQYYHRYDECVSFEKEFADFCGHKFAISTTSGTASLHIALLACGIERGDEVMLTPHVTYAVGNSVLCVGAKPVFVDIEEETLTIDPSKIEDKITSKTKAMIPVHTYGHPAAMDPITEIAEKYDLFVIEDVTHAVGSRYKGKKLPVGGEKNIGIFSFNSKQLWLPCGGGMVVTDNEEFAKKARLYSGWRYGGPHSGLVIGYNYMMADLAAIVGKAQFRYLKEYVDMQRSNAKILNELLEDTPVITPVEKEWAYHAYARYAIRAPKRDELMEFLGQQGIHCEVLYGTPTHLLKLYSEPFGYREEDFPVTEKEKKEELSLPEPRFRSRWEIEHIAKKIVEFYASPHKEAKGNFPPSRA